MINYTDRRLWLKQTAMALAGLGLSSFNKIAANYSPEAAILLANNENAYGPSPAAQKAILETYLQSNRYPDDAILVLQKAVAAHWKLAEENILLGAGSSEIIGLACQLAAQKKGYVISADPSYQEWNGQAAAFGLSFKRNHLPRNGELVLEKLFGPVTADTRMIYICNPNNPTGMALDTKAIAGFAQSAAGKSLVFIDEAYAEYAQTDSLAKLAVTNPNIIVAKTFSKIYGLAGARIGYAIAHPATIRTLTSYQPWLSANLSAVSAAAAIASLDDSAFVHDCYEKNQQVREYCYGTFKQLGLDYIPSAANFILLNIDKMKDRFVQGMQRRNVQLKYRDAYGGKWCRVTMGTMEEMQSFTIALKEING
jgi:histidinol-phosphate aminotransferase